MNNKIIIKSKIRIKMFNFENTTISSDIDSHPYNLLDNKKIRKLVDKVLLGQEPISVLNKYFAKNKFLAYCLVDKELADDFGFFELNKKCLKKLIGMWIRTGDGFSSKLPPEIIKHMDVYDLFIYCLYWGNPTMKVKNIINQYKKYNKPRVSFEKLFNVATDNDAFSGGNVSSILCGVDCLMVFAKEFNAKIKPIVDHPYKSWNISECDLDEYAEYFDENEKLKKRKLQNFRKLFKKWYSNGYKRFFTQHIN